MQLEQKVFYRFTKVISNFAMFFIIAGALGIIIIENSLENVTYLLSISIILLVFVNIVKQSILYVAYGKKISFNFIKSTKCKNHTEQRTPQKWSLSNPIKRYLKGEYGLCRTYWGTKIFILIFLGAIAIWYNSLFLKTQIKYHFLFSTVVLSTIIPAYIAIYKAAMKYKGKNIWSALAILSLISGVAQILPLITNSSENINNEVLQLKKSLPIKINDTMDLVKVNHSNNLVTFTYKVNKDKLKHPLNATSTTINICKNNELLNQKNINKIRYQYIDSDSSMLMNVVIDNEICQSILDMGENEYYLKNMLENYNKKLPIKLDEITELVNISSSKEKISYQYRVNVASNMEDMLHTKKLINTNKSSIIKSLCKSSEKPFKFRKNIEYNYKNTEGKNITAFNIYESDCRN